MTRPFKGTINVDIRDSKPSAPAGKETQYHEMLSTRGIWHKGWKASTEHGPLLNKGEFDQDRWQLFHTDVDRSEAHDLADRYPEKVKELAALWFEEARKNMGVSFKILAEVEFTTESLGVIVSQGSRFGGYTMFVRDGQLTFVYNFLGIPPEQKLSCPAPTSGKHVIGVEFKKKTMGKTNEVLGTMTLYVDDEATASADFRTQSGHYALAGEGLAVGYDSGDAITKEYQGRFRFTGGEVIKVIYDVADDVYVDMERELAAALARD